MLHAFLVMCLSLNSYYCQSVEFIRADYSSAVTPIDCAMGGLILFIQIDQQQEKEGFLKDGVRWHIRGIRCVEDNGIVVGADLADRAKEHIK